MDLHPCNGFHHPQCIPPNLDRRLVELLLFLAAGDGGAWEVVTGSVHPD